MKLRINNPSRRRQAGVTLVELVCVTAIVLLLAGVAIPVAGTMVKRQKELELRQALRTIRKAIDRFQMDAVSNRYPGMSMELNATNEDKYPEELEQLVEGIESGLPNGMTMKYLRKLPKDPITRESEWTTRSSKDRPGSLFSDKTNIFDVRSKSDKTALDGTLYSEW